MSDTDQIHLNGKTTSNGTNGKKTKKLYTNNIWTRDSRPQCFMFSLHVFSSQRIGFVCVYVRDGCFCGLLCFRRCFITKCAGSNGIAQTPEYSQLKKARTIFILLCLDLKKEKQRKNFSIFRLILNAILSQRVEQSQLHCIFYT